jgi:WG containing repeat
MRFLQFTLAFTLTAVLVVSAQNAEPTRFPVQMNDKWGFMDDAGKLVIPARFANAHDFYESLAAVEEKGKWGFIDEGGAWVIEPRFEDAADFDAGFAGVKVKGVWGFIDQRGHFTIPPKWEYIRCFHNGSPPAVDIGNNQWRYLDDTRTKLGAVVTPHPLGFSEGMAPAENRESRTGFVDVHGRFVIPPQFDDARGFSESLAAVQIGGKWGAIDTTGHLVISPQFSRMDDFSEGVAVVDIDSREGIIRRDGSWLLRPQYIDIGRMSESRARVGDAEGGWKRGYLDEFGNLSIPIRFTHVTNFRAGVARVETGDGIAYIDRNGNYVWPPTR